eukprot:Sspe_Gene.99096::Locus_72481_Transcript_1_1_Confidence_1.000_Length_1549::g.99096::m.99096
MSMISHRREKGKGGKGCAVPSDPSPSPIENSSFASESDPHDTTWQSPTFRPAPDSAPDPTPLAGGTAHLSLPPSLLEDIPSASDTPPLTERSREARRKRPSSLPVPTAHTLLGKAFAIFGPHAIGVDGLAGAAYVPDARGPMYLNKLKDSLEVNGNCISAANCGLVSLEELGQALTAGWQMNPTRFASIHHLDITGNGVQELRLGAVFPDLLSLIADSNGIAVLACERRLPNLQTLWLNRNTLADLDGVLQVLSNGNAPSLKCLSLLGNPCCPGPVDMHWYRAYVAHHLPSLTFLDEREVLQAERDFFSGRPHGGNYVWFKMRQGWCKGALPPGEPLPQGDSPCEVHVWEVVADLLDVYKDPTLTEKVAELKKGSLVACTSASISNGVSLLEVSVGKGVPPRGWVVLAKRGGATPQLAHRSFPFPGSDVRPLHGQEALKKLGMEICEVVRKHGAHGEVIHNRLKVLYHRELGPKSPSLRAQREELGLQ